MACFTQMAERVGFEPTVPCTDTAVFKTAALNHSTTSPRRQPVRPAAPDCAAFAPGAVLRRTPAAPESRLYEF